MHRLWIDTLRFRNARLVLAGLAAAALLVFSATVASAQGRSTQVHDATALHPPAGSRVAIIEFEDLECPDCAAANPLLKEASEKYHIPWVRHDFPLPQHNWSTQAAINARWFDTKSKKTGDDYRDQVFANQISIVGLDGLRQFTEKFAQNHGIAMPFALDPMGKLSTDVKADYALGQKIGIEHTPTIWVVTANSKGAPFVEVVDRTKLYQLIDQAIEDTKSAAPAKAAAAKTAHK